MRNFYFLRTLFLASIILITLSVSGQVTLMPVDDGTAFKEMPDSTANYKDANNIFIYKTDSTEAIAFVKFEIEKFEGKIVSEAIFSTRSDMNDGTMMTVKLTKAGSTDFTRDSLTWNNKPGTSGELATVIYDEDSGRKEFTPNGTNLADYINDALAQGKKYIAFGLNYKDGDGGDFKWAGGAGNGSWGPMLELSFDEGFNYWAIDDGTAFKENPDTTANWKGASNIYVWKTDTTEAIAYIKFMLPGFAYKSVSSAEFSTQSDMQNGTTMTVALVGATSTDFTRDQLTWNNKPGTTGELATVLMDEESNRKTYVETGNQLVEFINSELAKGNEEVAFALKYKDGDGGDFKWAGGVGDGAWGPMLKVTEGMEGGGYATDDGFVLQAYPDSMASPNATNIFASKSSDTTERIAYVKFDVSAFAGKSVEEVKFSIRGAMKNGTMTLGLNKLNTTDFVGDSLTWNTRPGTGSEVATLIMDTDSKRKYFISSGNALADYVNQVLMSGNEEIGFALKYKEGEGELNWIGGKDDGTYGPMLELEFGYGFNSYAIDDGTGFKENPDTTANWKKATNLLIWKTDTTEAISYVKFDVSALAGETITDAVFSTRAAMTEEGKTMTVALVEAKSPDFTRNNLTWNDRPGTGDELATVVIEKSSARKEYIPNGTKLIDFVNAKLAAMETEIAFAIKYKEGDGAESDFSWCGGAGDGAYGPLLELEIEKPVSVDTITVIEDAYVLEAYPDSTGDGIADMQIGRDDTNNADKESFLKFPVEEKASPVGKVTLLLKGAIKDTNPDDLEKFTIQIVGVSNAWAEDTIDWDNKPAEESEVLATYDITGSAVHEVTGDALAHYINDVVRAGATEVSFVVKGKDDTGENRAWISSQDWVAAQMILDYTVAPPVQEGNVIEDAYVSQVEAERDTAIGNEADQHLINDDTNENSKWIYFKYDLSKAYDNPVSATLKLYGSIHDSSNDITEFDYRIFAANNNNWGEDTITWNTRPSVSNNVLLEGTLVDGGAWYELSSPAFSEYIAEAVEDGKQQITLVAKGAEETPGNRAWISGKEWNGSSLIINYEPQVEAPTFNPVPGEYIAEVEVEIMTATPDATIYYTTDGTEPTDASIEYTGKIILNDSTTIKAIGYAGELKPSIVTSAEYDVTPVGIPTLFPSPLVTYTDDNPPVVQITVEPADAFIVYSDDGSDPSTPYPEGGIPLTQTTTLMVQAISADGNYYSPIVEATYVVEATVEGIGIGPGGVGFSDNSISGQPENTLWLKADEIEGLTDGDLVSSWTDMSGNENNATDIYAGTTPADYHKNIEEAPVYVSNGVSNDMPAVNFGPIEGRESEIGALAIPDNAEEDYFDGMGGLSLWLVTKRNTVTSDFTALVEKRNFYQGPEENAWILQYNGGGGPDEFNFEMRKEDRLITTNTAITDVENTYVIGTDLRAFERVTLWKNGEMKASMNYSKPINDVDAPLVIGNALRDNLAEVIFYKNGLNEAQKVIVQNYLAAKYDVPLTASEIYTHEVYAHEVIGVGKKMYNDKAESHLASSGGALQLEAAASTLDAGEFVFAGHNGAANSNDNADKTWARRWYIQKSAEASVDVKLGFDFAAAGIETPASTDGYAVWHSTDGETFTALPATGTMEEDVMIFDLTDVADGFYVLSVGEVTNNRTISEMNNLVNLYPNPATGNANLVINNAVDGDFTINIHNMTGSLVQQIKSAKAAGPHTEMFDVSQFKPGIYIIEVVQGNSRVLKRLIKK